MYLIVVGAGKIGSNLIELATRDGNDVVVIEQDEGRANEVSSQYDCLVLNADATADAVLDDAGIDRADAVISTTNLDAVNTMVMLLAREHDVPSLVSVVHDPRHMPIFEKIGVNVIENPQRLIADHLYHSVRFPGVEDFMDLGAGAELVEVTVEEGAPIADRELAAAREAALLPDGMLVVVIKRGSDIITPGGETTLRPGDLATVFVNESAMADVLTAFGHPESNGA